MKKVTVKEYSHLDDIEIDLGYLFRSCDDNLFYSKEWFLNYEKNIPDEYEKEFIFLLVEAGQDDTDKELPLGIMFLRVDSKSIGTVHYKILTSLSNYYATYHNVILHDDYDSESLISMLVDAIDAKKHKFTAINFGPFPENDNNSRLICEKLKDKGWFAYFYNMYGNWYLDVGKLNFDQYYKTISSRVRNTIKRKEKKLYKEHEVEYMLYTDAKNIGIGISQFEEIYKASWKIDEPYPEFVRGLINMSAINGWIRLGVISINNIPIASQLWIVKDKTAYIYKLAYDEKYKNLSAGSILTERLMRHVIDIDKATRIDYLTGDDSYKRDWMPSRRQIVGLMAYNTTFKGSLLKFGYVVKKSSKNIVEKIAAKFHKQQVSEK